jgi:hypothetical protein
LRPAAAAAASIPRPTLNSSILQFQKRNMSEIKKVFTQNACPRKYRTVLAAVQRVMKGIELTR